MVETICGTEERHHLFVLSGEAIRIGLVAFFDVWIIQPIALFSGQFASDASFFFDVFEGAHLGTHPCMKVCFHLLRREPGRGVEGLDIAPVRLSLMRSALRSSRV